MFNMNVLSKQKNVLLFLPYLFVVIKTQASVLEEKPFKKLPMFQGGRNVYSVSSAGPLTSYVDAESLSMATSSPSPTTTSSGNSCSRKNSLTGDR